MSPEAVLWEPLAAGSARCTVCPHRCVIRNGGVGLCRVRGVTDGRMQSLVYGRPATVVSDEIEKKQLYHFHPGTRALSLGTLGCNVLCAGCPNWQISHAGAGAGEFSRLPTLLPDEAVAMARKHKLAGVAWTYNDPAVWIEYVHDVAMAFREAGLYTAFVTAGYLSSEALDYVAPYLDAFKFDLKAPGVDGWSRLTKVKDPAPAMEAAVRAVRLHGCHVEVVSNIVPGVNDDDESLNAMAAWVVYNLGVKTPWHVTRFLPDFELNYLKPTPIAVLERAAAFGRSAGLEFVYVGNVPGHASRNTNCPACGRTAIRRGDRGVEQAWVRDGRCASCGEDLRVVMGSTSA
ncbi:MAG TPA: AmmeMemoRadiSam system radical SAM enzyme [Thermoleophilia bacterium]|nr:AmmeMemoRadiSam system radical SAM enzyme [Thermoleophilia bacterium]